MQKDLPEPICRSSSSCALSLFLLVYTGSSKWVEERWTVFQWRPKTNIRQ